MHPILFKIGGVTFYTHGVLAVLGIILCGYMASFFAKKENLEREFLFDNIVWSVLVGIIGARVTYFLLYRDQFSKFSEIFYLQNGGLVSFGGFIPGALIFALLLKYQKQPILKWLDILAIGFSFGLFLGRIGNLMAGEYAGKVSFSRYAIDHIIPINLYEGIWVLVLGLIMIAIYLKAKNLADGFLLWFFVLFYGLGRFVIDFWRSEKILLFHLNSSQVTCLVLVIVGLFAIVRTLRAGRMTNGTV